MKRELLENIFVMAQRNMEDNYEDNDDLSKEELIELLYRISADAKRIAQMIDYSEEIDPFVIDEIVDSADGLNAIKEYMSDA